MLIHMALDFASNTHIHNINAQPVDINMHAAIYSEQKKQERKREEERDSIVASDEKSIEIHKALTQSERTNERADAHIATFASIFIEIIK